MKKYLKYLFFLIPLVLGFFGFLQLGNDVLGALYHSVRLFALEFDASEVNTYLEFARWLAPLATAGFVVTLFTSLRRAFDGRLRAHRKNSCSVYGQTADAAALLSSLGRDGIKGSDDRILCTENHVLMFETDAQNIAFFSAHEEKLRRGRVYIQLESDIQSFDSPGVTVFSRAENTSLLYWRRYPMLENGVVTIIGGGALLEQLLINALLTNLFSPSQHILYRVFDSDDRCRFLHGDFTAMAPDDVVFYTDEWYRHIDEISGSSRIILCGAENQEISGRLLGLLSEPVIHLCANSVAFFDAFYGGRVTVFGEANEVSSRETVLREGLLDGAKALNEHYRSLYGGDGWENLDLFKRRSNISACEFSGIIRRLYAEGVGLETLAELEHMRWSRFHLLSGWRFGMLRDNKKHLHPLLVAYNELSAEQKQKDIDNVKLALNKNQGEKQ